MKNDDKDILAETVARLRREGLSQQAPRTVVEETIRQLREAQLQVAVALSTETDPGRRAQPLGRRIIMRFSLAAAALIAVGFAIGKSSQPAPVNMDELREALAPSLASAIEPAIRTKLTEEMEHRYRLALAATYVKVKEELTDQYRDDLNRFAVQFLAASNATTNQRLSELIQSIDTMQAEDLSEVARALHRIEQKHVQDRAQLAAGLQTVASGLTRTRRELAQLFVDVPPEDIGNRFVRPIEIPNERNEP